MKTRSPIETTTRYATTVEDLGDAWTFVMDRLDRVGPDPSVTISPCWVFHDDGTQGRHFEVVVSGMVEEASDD